MIGKSKTLIASPASPPRSVMHASVSASARRNASRARIVDVGAIGAQLDAAEYAASGYLLV